MKKLLLIFLLTSMLTLTYADTNGVWHLASDVRGGVFGSNEQPDTSGFSFINPVTFNEEVTVDGYNLVINNGGSVGIGTNPGTQNFHINDDVDSLKIAYSGTPPNPGDGVYHVADIIYKSNDGSGKYWDMAVRGAGGTTPYAMGFSFFNNNDGTGNPAVVSNWAIGMWMSQSGNVGIKTEIPTQALDVNGKIRMRSQTQTTDAADIVATKGYVDSVAATGVSLVQNTCQWVNAHCMSGHSCGTGNLYTGLCPVGYYMAGMRLYTWELYATYNHQIYCCLAE